MSLTVSLFMCVCLCLCLCLCLAHPLRPVCRSAINESLRERLEFAQRHLGIQFELRDSELATGSGETFRSCVCPAGWEGERCLQRVGADHSPSSIRTRFVPLVDHGTIDARNYGNNELQSYVLRCSATDLNAARVPRLTFSEFSTESCCDRVLVYDSFDSSVVDYNATDHSVSADYSATDNSGYDSELLNASGSRVPSPVTGTAGHVLLVRFFSDYSITSSGFLAAFACIN